MINIANLIARSKKLEEEIKNLEQLIADAPDGRLVVRKSQILTNGYWYSNITKSPDGKMNEKYIGKKDVEKARQLANRMYAEKKLRDLKKEKTLIDRMIAFRMNESEAEKFLKSHRNLWHLLEGVSLSENRELLKWKNAEYNRSTKYPEHLIFPTIIPGLKVRSKSEADIVSRFEYFGVPYHYEELTLIGNSYYAMDFTCKNVRTFRTFYWDHRGRMDDPDYIRRKISCDSEYMKAGIIPGINLIVTTETKDHPLDIQWVDELIQYYLL